MASLCANGVIDQFELVLRRGFLHGRQRVEFSLLSGDLLAQISEVPLDAGAQFAQVVGRGVAVVAVVEFMSEAS